jgi:hypothetical protein
MRKGEGKHELVVQCNKLVCALGAFNSPKIDVKLKEEVGG